MTITVLDIDPGSGLSDSVRATIRTTWESLQERAHTAYFLSWGWVETWLDSLPRDLPLRFVRIEEEETPLCACFLRRKRIRRARVISRAVTFLNVTADPIVDDLCIEYNDILCIRPDRAVWGALVEWLWGQGEEVDLPALDARGFVATMAQRESPGMQVVIDRRRPSYVVHLTDAHTERDGYLSGTSPETRRQIRRAFRGYTAIGAVGLEEAVDLDAAVGIFDELVDLHRQSWRRKGLPSSFDSPFFERFHRALITSRFSRGEIQLCRIGAGDRTIGCLYSFVWDGRVHYYQSGFNYEADPHLKPGLVCHTAAIVHNARKGHREYDFLYGEDRYKRSLANGCHEQIWVRLQKPLPKFRAERTLRGIQRLLPGRKDSFPR